MPWPWCRECRKLCDYKKELAERKTIQIILIANFGGRKVFWNPHISRTDFPHQQWTSPFLLPTPRIIGRPPEFPSAGIKHVASWSEAEGQWGSFPCWEELKAAKRSSPNFSDVAAPWRRHDQPWGDKPDLSGALLLSATTLPPFFSMSLLPIFSSLLFLPLFKLDAQVVLSLPALGAGPLCHKLHLAISPPILRRFPWSQRLQKALEKTFR